MALKGLEPATSQTLDQVTSHVWIAVSNPVTTECCCCSCFNALLSTLFNKVNNPRQLMCIINALFTNYYELQLYYIQLIILCSYTL